MPHFADAVGAASTFSGEEMHGGFRRKVVPVTFSLMSWPKTVPDDLRHKLEAVLGYRNRPAPQDVWGAVVEWLEAENVEVPSVGGTGCEEAPHRGASNLQDVSTA